MVFKAAFAMPLFALATLSLSSPLAFGKNSAQSQEDTMMSSLFDGPPKLAGTVLDPSAYVVERVQRLKNAKVAYVNWEAVKEILRQMGYVDVPKKLTPALSKAILDRVGFAKQLAVETAEDYGQEFRDLYSIRYGGHWINFNFGSGRNGATGIVDVKGIGKTILVRPWADSGHSDGMMTLKESLKEAIWSNVLHQTLPLGANRVLFIITTGTLTDPNDPNSEPRSLVVREDPVRPAYYQPNDGVKQKLMADSLREMHTAADQKRMEKVLPRLLEALPLSDAAQSLSDAEKLRAGLFEMVDRIALQYATAFTQQILLAGASTSNVEIDGTALDYGSTTALIGFPRARYLKGEAPNGSTESLKNDLILEFAQDLRASVPASWLTGLPSDSELSARLDKRYEAKVRQGFLELVGAPHEFSSVLERSDAGHKLSQTLMQIARAGNDEILDWREAGGSWYEERGVGRTGTFNFARVVDALTKGDTRNLKLALPNENLRLELTKDFHAYFAELVHQAKKEDIGEFALRRYMLLAVPARNRSLYELRSRKVFWSRLQKVRPQQTQDVVDQSYLKNVKEFKGAPYQLVLPDTSRLRSGQIGRRIFDLRSGQTTLKFEAIPGFDRTSSCDRLLEK